MHKLLILIPILVLACIPEGPSKKTRSIFKAKDLEGPRKKNSDDFFPPPQGVKSIYWSNKTTSFSDILKISESFDSILYLRGKALNDYLQNELTGTTIANNYCLVFNFNNPQSKDQYRARAVVENIHHFKEKQQEYALRVDFHLESQECEGNINTFDKTRIGKVILNTNDPHLYITTTGENGRGIYTYSANNGYSNISSAHGFISNDTRDVWVQSANPGKIIVATSKGLSISTNGPQNFSSHTISQGLTSNNLSSIHAGPLGQAFVVGSDNGISLSSDNGQSYTNRNANSGLSSNNVSDVWTDGGSVFVATDQGLDFSANFGSTFTSLLSEKIIAISSYESGNNTKILVSSESGLHIYGSNGALIKSLTTSEHLPSNRVRTSFYNGNIIALATDKGVVLYNDPINAFSNSSGGLIEVITTLNGLPSNNINNIVINGNKIYITTPSKLYERSFSEVGIPFTEIHPATFTLRLNDICPLCQNLISSKTKLYKIDPTTHDIQESSLVTDLDQDIAYIGLNVQKGLEKDTIKTDCSNSRCHILGYDCCLNGQCVKDGEEKPDSFARAQSDPSGFGTYYNEAKHKVSQNPINFIDYSDIYYICPQTVVQESNARPSEDTNIEFQLRFEQEKKEYFCLETVKNNPHNYSKCWDDNQDTSIDEDDWESIRRKVWKRCGCRSKPLEEPYCPDYGLRAERNHKNEIIAVLCTIPAPLQEHKPLQDLNIDLSTRTVPHRFYRQDNGKPVDDITTLHTEKHHVVQEGTHFSYLDPHVKKSPKSDRFNINSILGPININLSQSLPAKVIPVEFDQDYIIMATDGLHIPCPECHEDSWFSAFWAHPSSSMGMGLQAIGTTTRRDIFSLNRTRGNYEDTLFGRACWLPPTMLPFSHRPVRNTVTQRRRRLMTQAALYINGYQRDWYGFNKGALIGSFNGVQWFAIGTGRRVTATSEKLYLAINAPFGDLAAYGNINVSITVDLEDNEASDVDFDPSLSLVSPKQNQGATCQRYHLCKTDTDCVTQLGWEYMCAHIAHYKSSWPNFNVHAEEKQNSQIAQASFIDIIFGEIPFLNNTTKRCVYRGSGAICSRNLSAYKTDSEKKLFACAPNFYCAEITADQYNAELVRESDGIRRFLYGQDSNVLGRPLNYVDAKDTLPIEVINNLQYNASSHVYIDGTDFESELGLCLPGKDVSKSTVSWADQQIIKDYAYRTDYINQIASCDSQSYESIRHSRVQSCPTFILDKDHKDFGNYVHFQAPNPFTTTGPRGISSHRTQNMCGGQTVTNSDNPFASIEAGTLTTLKSILTPTLVKDACLKRAGSPCFTDLDCGPNRLHKAETIYFDERSFGGSLAEYEYWSQDLICSQDKFDLFRFNKNRCCRNLNSDFTMYTQIEDTTDDLMNYLGLSDDPIEQNPRVEFHPGRNLDGRAGYVSHHSGEYSRYTIVDMVRSIESNYVGTGAQPRSPIVYLRDNFNSAAYQWKTLSETGKKTCCGETWIRQFADGTHNWIDFKKLNINFENFRCLNYTSPLIHGRPNQTSMVNWNKEGDRMCLYPSGHGCIQWGLYQAEQYNIQAPKNFTPPSFSEWKNIMEGTHSTYGKLFVGSNNKYASCAGGGICGYFDTTPESGQCGSSSLDEQRLTPLSPYLPLLLDIQSTPDGDPHRNSCVQVSLGNSNEPVQLSMNLPSYIGDYSNIQGIQFKFFDSSGASLNQGSEECQEALDDCGTVTLRGSNQDLTGRHGACSNGASIDSYPFGTYFDSLSSIQNGIYDGSDINGSGAWCVHTDPAGRQVLKVGFNKYRTFAGEGWIYASIRLEFNPIGTTSWTGPSEEQQGTLPGNDFYYLTKLGRLELLGIPQIFYEPLYCTYNYDKLVPDLYTDHFYSATNQDDRSRVENSHHVFSYSTSRYGTGRTLEKIYDKDFSGNDFTKSLSPSIDGYFMHGNMINHKAIFSAHEFTCCQALGKVVETSSQCCSGFSVERQAQNSNENVRVCKLPNGTNLNVYFNRFVSNEGQGKEQPGGGLNDDDFIPETGEIKLQTSSYEKLQALGAFHCDSESTVRGGAFGFFQGSPNPGFTLNNAETHPTGNLRYSLVDEISDNDDSSNSNNPNGEGNTSGGPFFQNGLHWSHHLYCNATE